MIAFDVGQAKPDHSPSVKSVGIVGQLTGTRADEIIADDVEVANNSLTQVTLPQRSPGSGSFCPDTASDSSRANPCMS